MTNIEDESREKDLKFFNEKIFDRIYNLENANEQALAEMCTYKGEKLTIDNFVLEKIDNNLRHVVRGMQNFRRIMAKLATKELDCTKEELLNLCLLQIIKAYKEDDSYKKYLEMKQKSNLNLIFYSIYNYVSDLDENALNNIIKKNPKEEPELDIVKNEYALLDSEYFYLSDKNKASYLNLVEEIFAQDNNVLDKRTETLIATYINAKKGKLEPWFFDKVVNLYSKDIDHFSSSYLYLIIKDKGGEYLIKILKELGQAISSKKSESRITEIRNAIKNEDYHSAVTLIERARYSEMESKISEEMVTNNFYFPDFSGNISQDVWSYCHQITKIFGFQYKDEFVNLFKTLYKRNPTKSLLERVSILITQYIDSDFDCETLDK